MKDHLHSQASRVPLPSHAVSRRRRRPHVGGANLEGDDQFDGGWSFSPPFSAIYELTPACPLHQNSAPSPDPYQQHIHTVTAAKHNKETVTTQLQQSHHPCIVSPTLRR